MLHIVVYNQGDHLCVEHRGKVWDLAANVDMFEVSKNHWEKSQKSQETIL